MCEAKKVFEETFPGWNYDKLSYVMRLPNFDPMGTSMRSLHLYDNSTYISEYHEVSWGNGPDRYIFTFFTPNDARRHGIELPEIPDSPRNDSQCSYFMQHQRKCRSNVTFCEKRLPPKVSVDDYRSLLSELSNESVTRPYNCIVFQMPINLVADLSDTSILVAKLNRRYFTSWKIISEYLDNNIEELSLIGNGKQLLTWTSPFDKFQVLFVHPFIDLELKVKFRRDVCIEPHSKEKIWIDAYVTNKTIVDQIYTIV